MSYSVAEAEVTSLDTGVRSVVLRERNVFGHPLAGLLRERKTEAERLRHHGEKVPMLECLHVHRKSQLSLSVYVDDIKMVGDKETLGSTLEILLKTSTWKI